jgi:hypothetical protein
LGFLLSAWVLLAADASTPLDLLQHDPADKAQLRSIGPGEYEWSLPDGLTQSLHFDLTPMGIQPGDYDEFRFDLRPEGSLVFVQAILSGFPAAGLGSSWYSKFKSRVDEWTEGRFDLRLDDDGIFLGGELLKSPPGRFTLTLSRQLLGLPGEPTWRKARIRNPRFIRYPVAVTFSLADCEMETEGAEVAYTYSIHLKNRTDRKQTVQIDPDSDRALKYFKAVAEAETLLEPHATQDVRIRLSIPRTQALRLPPLYGESIVPRISVKGLTDSDVVPIMGYRRWPLWGVVPIFNRVTWTPATLQAFLDARQKALPGIADWRKNVIAAADSELPLEWPMPKNMLPAHVGSYRCREKDCAAQLKPANPMEFHKHICPKCKKVYENDDVIDRAYVYVYYSRRGTAIQTCALAWLLTGQEAYAKKSADMLLSLAEAYPSMPVSGERSTSGAAKLGPSSLLAAYILPSLAEGYQFLAAAPVLDAEKRRRIEAVLNDEALRIARHCVAYSNMTAEHFRAYGSVAIATGFWPLAGEAISGEFGWHELVERGYSEDGIAHEGGAYHRAVFQAMEAFASFAYGQNVNLYTSRFKRVFDGSLTVGGDHATASYETAYAVYRDPAYLGILARQRSRAVSGETIFQSVLGLANAQSIPVVSAHMPGTGYLFLRKGNASDSYEIRLNYIKFFDRDEHDKFTTVFFRNGQQVETWPGRMSYGDRNSKFMSASAAHNVVVIDGQDERAVDGRLIAYVPDPETPLAVVATDPAAPLYEGVQQLRAIALIENNYIVFDAVRAERPCTIDRYQYGRGQATIPFKLTPVDTNFPCLPHPEYRPIEQVEVGDCGKQAVIGYKGDFTLTLVSENELQFCKGLTHGGYGGQPMEVTFARASNARAASFLAAFTWGKDPAPPSLRIQKNTPEEIVLEVKIATRIYTIRIDPIKKSAAVVK